MWCLTLIDAALSDANWRYPVSHRSGKKKAHKHNKPGENLGQTQGFLLILHSGSPANPGLSLGQSQVCPGRRAAQKVYVKKVYVPFSLANRGCMSLCLTILNAVSSFTCVACKSPESEIQAKCFVKVSANCGETFDKAFCRFSFFNFQDASGQPAPKYHTKGCSRSSADSPGARTLVFAAFEQFSSCEFRARIARTRFCAILWRSPKWPQEISWKIGDTFHEPWNKILSPRDSESFETAPCGLLRCHLHHLIRARPPQEDLQNFFSLAGKNDGKLPNPP